MSDDFESFDLPPLRVIEAENLQAGDAIWGYKVPAAGWRLFPRPMGRFRSWEAGNRALLEGAPHVDRLPPGVERVAIEKREEGR